MQLKLFCVVKFFVFHQEDNLNSGKVAKYTTLLLDIRFSDLSYYHEWENMSELWTKVAAGQDLSLQLEAGGGGGVGGGAQHGGGGGGGGGW